MKVSKITIHDTETKEDSKTFAIVIKEMFTFHNFFLRKKSDLKALSTTNYLAKAVLAKCIWSKKKGTLGFTR